MERDPRDERIAEREALVAKLMAAAWVLVAFLVTAFIVVHINLRLFFGPVMDGLAEARSLA